MHCYTFSVLVYFELVFCQVISGILQNTGHLTGYDGYFLNVASLAVYPNHSLLRCAKECAKHGACLSFNYNEISRVCSISDKTKFTNPGEYMADAAYTYCSDWEPDTTTVAPTTTPYDECLNNPCHINAVCSNIPGGFECTCNAGFTGDGLSCIDDDECLTSPCDTNAVCTNNPGGFECTCNAGFLGGGLGCSDDDECLTSPCDTNAVCTNNPGSFECACNVGFTGDGLNCVPFCEDKLGMENGDIPNSNIAASSSFSSAPAIDGRLNKNDAVWTPLVEDVEKWIEADIGYQTYVSGVITQGDGNIGSSPDWVTSFKVSTYLNSGDTEVFIADPDGTAVEFFGNEDDSTPVTTLFPEPVLARIVRITCLTKARSDGYYQMRFEITGCK